MVTQVINFKRGDSLSLQCKRTDSLGADVDLTGVIITAQARTVSFVDDLVVDVTSDITGDFTLSASATQTGLWPTGVLFCDIQFQDIGVESSDTFVIYVVEDVTRAN